MKVPVFYRPEMSVANNNSFSPSAGKPALAVNDWIATGMPIEIMSFDPVTDVDLSLAHDTRYVSSIMSGEERNGFYNRNPQVAEACRYTCGSMLAASRHALTHGMACSPSSGFHHAGYDFGGGFCTFNGLALSAVALVINKRKVAILDLDQHYGNGTDHIIRKLRLPVKMYSWNAARPSARAFLSELCALVSELIEGADVLLYQAGADPHIDDPLGGYMTSQELEDRDRIVFEAAAKARVPVAWNLAGGYQRDHDGSIAPTLSIHRKTMEVAANVMGQPGWHWPAAGRQ